MVVRGEQTALTVGSLHIFCYTGKKQEAAFILNWKQIQKYKLALLFFIELVPMTHPRYYVQELAHNMYLGLYGRKHFVKYAS